MNPRRAGSTRSLNEFIPVVRPAPVTACADLHVGPHNRCTHGTPPPPGLVRCKGDSGCAFRVPAGGGWCWQHGDVAHVSADALRDEIARAWGVNLGLADRPTT